LLRFRCIKARNHYYFCKILVNIELPEFDFESMISMIANRLSDTILAGLGIIIGLPLFLFISIVIKVSSSGPVIYSQQRVGKNGRIFMLYKFRSMVNRAGIKPTSVTTSKDKRITIIGKILRKTKLDELPQFLNVLKGDMSFVGPRPDVPEIVKNYSSDMKRIFNIRPGITSLASLHLRNEEEILAQVVSPDLFYENILVPFKVKLAMEHLDKNSFLFDLKILLQTIWMITPFGKIFPVMELPQVAKFKQEHNIK
jgi:lipopolysaccharide/colanic/teichoic acid biosynthesis glycosyltransferase